MLKANKKYSGNLQKDIIELRGLSKNDLFPKKIKYEPSKQFPFYTFMNWNKEFVIFADCDTDGLCAAAICKLYLNKTDAPEHTIHYKIASRNRRGFQKQDVVEILRDYPKATGILTVDCGIVANEACDFADDNDLDVFITDHHNPGEKLPFATILNPKLDTEYEGFKDFCGAGVIYLLLKHCFGEVDGAIQYAAIATVADMVPLVGDNRYIVQKGIKELRNPKKKHTNIDALFSGLGAFVLNEKDIGWSIAPAINAASRLEMEHVAFEAVVLADRQSITKLGALNDERKLLVAKLYNEGKELIQLSTNAASINIKTSGKTGIIGLVAMKLHVEFDFPAIAYANGDDGKTYFSIRAPRTTSFIDSVREMGFDVNGGGHDEAGGFSVSHGEIDIINKFHEFYDAHYDTLEVVEGERFDIEISLDQLIFNLDDKDELRPFGVGFQEPVFVSNDVIFVDDGLTKNKKHQRYKIYQSTQSDSGAVFIDFDKKADGAGRYSMAYKLSYNSYLKGPQVEIIEMYKIK